MSVTRLQEPPNGAEIAPIDPCDPAVRARLTDVVRKRANRVYLAGFACLIGWIGAGVALSALFRETPWVEGLVVAVAVPALAGWPVVRASKKEDQLVRQLISSDNLSAFALLLNATEFTRGKLKLEVHDKLGTMAPSVASGVPTELTLVQRICLNRLLFAGDVDLTLATLKLLQAQGDSTCLPYVNALANGRSIPAKDRARAAEIVAESQQCLGSVNARDAAMNIAGTLLRPSGYDSANVDTLVRAVHGGDTANSSELLRAGGVETSRSTKEDQI